jgi:hypothetical protein
MTWITDRLPTEEDGDRDGDVICLESDDTTYVTFTENVDLGTPWKPLCRDTPEPETKPTTRYATQISAVCNAEDILNVFALCNDGTIWRGSGTPSHIPVPWRQLPPIPQPDDQPPTH